MEALEQFVLQYEARVSPNEIHKNKLYTTVWTVFPFKFVGKMMMMIKVLKMFKSGDIKEDTRSTVRAVIAQSV
jgi:hypothetical protein